MIRVEFIELIFPLMPFQGFGFIVLLIVFFTVDFFGDRTLEKCLLFRRTASNMISKLLK